jgi:hypothetical protein
MTSFGSGGAVVATRNVPGVPVFRNPPEQTLREAPEAVRAEALLAVHRQAIRDAGLAALPLQADAIAGQESGVYRRYCEFQEELGLVRRDPERRRWVATPLAHAKYLLLQVVPRRADLAPRKLLPAALFGAVLPTAMMMFAARRGEGGAIAPAAVFLSGLAAGALFQSAPWRGGCCSPPYRCS